MTSGAKVKPIIPLSFIAFAKISHTLSPSHLLNKSVEKLEQPFMSRVVGVKPVGRVPLHIGGDIRLNARRRPKVQNGQSEILGNALYHIDVIF